MKKRKTARKNTMPLITIGVGLLLMILAGAWLLYTSGVLGPGPAAPGAGENAEADLPFPEVDRVSPADAKAAYDLGTAVFLDVRSAQAYAQSHIANSINIPLEELPARIGELNPEDWIITYCT